MITRPLARFAYPLSVSVLLAAILTVAGFLMIAALPELVGMLGDARPTPSPTASPAPTSPMPGGPNQVAMSPGADCGGCHVGAGGAVGVNPIPVMAHPVKGWTDCTACHADDRLVKTAPGHASLHKADCLVCHKAPDTVSTAPERPHHLVTGQTCVTCHGSNAPLPTDMQGRLNCWICHPSQEFEGLFGSPNGSPSPLPSAGAGG